MEGKTGAPRIGAGPIVKRQRGTNAFRQEPSEKFIVILHDEIFLGLYIYMGMFASNRIGLLLLKFT
jgi:hypothetical protein